MSPVVAVRALEKWWSVDSGLRPVTFQISAGEFVVVRGRSGSGKSTLLALLAGWASPDRGTIEWADGIRPTDWADLALVPQVLALAAELTVAENVAAAVPRPRSDGDERVHLVLDRLDLADLADRFPDEISLGQQQRTALARAAVATPRLVLADEPTSHQDPMHVTSILDTLRRLTDGGSAVFVATHEQAVVDSADRLVDLDT